MKPIHVGLSLVFGVCGCECSRAPTSFEAWHVCAVPDSGSPVLGEAFTVSAGPGTNLDAGCSTALDGGQLVITVSGIDVAYGLGDEALPPDVTCEVAALPQGHYVVTQLGGSFTFDVLSGDAGFPICAP